MSNTNSKGRAERRFGVVGGLARSAAPTCFQDDSRQPAHRRITRIRHCLRAAPLRRRPGGGESTYDPTRRKFYALNVLKAMEGRGINVALIPCFVSHTFLRKSRRSLASASSTSSTRCASGSEASSRASRPSGC